MKKILLLIFYLSPIYCIGQYNPGKGLALYEDSLIKLESRIYKSIPDSSKLLLNTKFISLFERALKTDKSFDYPFDSLKSIARLASSDHRFKILNWNLPLSDGTFIYYGFIQSYNYKTKKYELFPLIDKSDDIKNLATISTDNLKWFGMLYYKIIEQKYKKKTYYTLLGWEGNDKISCKKIIDVISFNNTGIPKFGEALFEMGKQNPKRVIFEHSSSAIMSLRYDDQNELIVFDHLAPLSPAFEGQYQYYAPDLSYDGFEFKKGKWVYIKNVDARNGKSDKDKTYTQPGTKEKKEAKRFYNSSGKH